MGGAEWSDWGECAAEVRGRYKGQLNRAKGEYEERKEQEVTSEAMR